MNNASHSTAESLLAVEGLAVDYRLKGTSLSAIRDVSFALKAGEAVALVGESGSGKTTTAMAIAGLLSPNASVTGGEVRYRGKRLPIDDDVAMLPHRWLETSVVFQGAMNALNPVHRIIKQIAEPCMLKLGMSREQATVRARELLELVGIAADRGAAYPHQLSGGMRQRVMIAMALACRPSIVIGDEPTTALDVIIQAQILKLLAELRSQLNLALILITHDLSVVAECCDSVMIMYAGRIVEDGAVADIFENPKHPYTKLLIDSIPNPEQGKRMVRPIPGDAPTLQGRLSGCAFRSRCPSAMSICANEVPELARRGEGRVACHLHSTLPDAERGAGLATCTALGGKKARTKRMSDASNILCLESLQVHFPSRREVFDRILLRPSAAVRAVDGVDLTVRRGEIVAVVGESGSGKSTVGRAITKLIQPTGGKLLFDGNDMTSVTGSSALRPYRHRVQMIFQDAYQALNPRHTVFDIVAEPLRSLGLVANHTQLTEGVTQSLAATGLNPPEEFFARFPNELSGGQRQRVMIAGALAVQPELIVADEPISMLDVSIRAQILQVLMDLSEQRNMALLFITHDLPVAWLIADRIAVMYLGRIVEIGTAHDITFNPHHPYTVALSNATPKVRPDQKHRELRVLQGEVPSAARVPKGCRFHPRCPVAFDRCREEEPQAINVGPQHMSACWRVN